MAKAIRDSKGRSLAERIRTLDDGTRSAREIATAVGCSADYVRAARSRGIPLRANNIDRSVFESWADRKRRKQMIHRGRAA